jgi:endo-1,3-1,4-beta-glycanase ExoK
MRHPFVMMMLVILGLSAAHCDGTNSSDDTEGTDDTVSTDSGTESDGPFELLWTDDFDTIDTSKWQLMTHTWDGNLAQFTGTNASVSDGILSLALTETPDDTEKPFRGVEMRSIDTLTYGKLEASIRFAPGSAVVSSLVLIYTPWPPDDWNEIDIEFLGKNTQDIQFNHMVNIPPADPETGHIQFPYLAALDFDATEDFHTYTIEWVPEEVRFFVDGTLMYTATEEVSYLTLPQNILMTIWASDAPGWAGPVDDTTSPTSVTYDWIKVYRYIGE